MISTFRYVPVFGGATALWLALGLSPSLAGSDICAAYGPGFTSVEGSSTCIRIDGHVRVETGRGITTSSINNGWANGGARPASLQSNTYDEGNSGNAINGLNFGRSHVRLPEGAIGYAEPLR
jgi:hypothetical protein